MCGLSIQEALPDAEKPAGAWGVGVAPQAIEAALIVPISLFMVVMGGGGNVWCVCPHDGTGPQLSSSSFNQPSYSCKFCEFKALEPEGVSFYIWETKARLGDNDNHVPWGQV